MAKPIIMPRQGQSVETCIFGEWYKQKGDEVKIGDILFSYETDKASFEEEAKEEGILLDTFVEEGDEVPVLINVAVVGQPGESVDEFRPGGEAATVEAEPEKTEAVTTDAETEEIKDVEQIAVVVGSANSGELKISPRARNLAETSKVPVELLQGTGPGGRVIERDVEAARAAGLKVSPLAKEIAREESLVTGIEGTGLGGSFAGADMVSTNPVYATDYEIKKLPNIRKIIAKAMHASLQNSAQLTHHMGADARKLLALRKRFKAEFGEGKIGANITINDMVCWAVIRALKTFPSVNTHFLGDSIKYFSKVHLGLAVDTERGLMVPVVRNADDLSLEGLASQLKNAAEQCRKGSIDPELLSPEAATFTVSNLGNYGVEIFTPVINLPQSAILGVNTILPRPADLGDGVYGFVPTIGLSLTYDHRSLDGGEATRFLYEIRKEIENLSF